MTYTDHIINDKARLSRSKSAETRKVLLAQVFEKIGYRARKCVSMKELRTILQA